MHTGIRWSILRCNTVSKCSILAQCAMASLTNFCPMSRGAIEWTEPRSEEGLSWLWSCGGELNTLPLASGTSSARREQESDNFLLHFLAEFVSVQGLTRLELGISLTEIEKVYKIAKAQLRAWKITTQNMCKKRPKLQKPPKTPKVAQKVKKKKLLEITYKNRKIAQVWKKALVAQELFFHFFSFGVRI